MKIPKSPQRVMLGLFAIRIGLELSQSSYCFSMVPLRGSRVQSSTGACMVLGMPHARRRIRVCAGLPGHAKLRLVTPSLLHREQDDGCGAVEFRSCFSRLK